MQNYIQSKVGYTMKFKGLLSKVIIYSWQASSITFLLLMLISGLFCGIKFLEIAVVEKLVAGVGQLVKNHDFQVIIHPVMLLGLILVLTPVLEFAEFITRGYFWRRGHGFMQGLFHNRVGKKTLVCFENQHALDEMKKASLGSSETPNSMRVLIQVIFLYIPFFVVVAFYLFSIKPLLMLVLIFISIPLLIAEYIKMNNTYDFQEKVANLRRKIIYYEKCMIDRTYYKDTLQNNAYEYFNSKLLMSISDFTEKHKHLSVKSFLVEGVMNTLNLVGYVGVIVLLMYYLLKGIVDVSEFAAVYYAVDKIAKMMKRLIQDIGEVMEELVTTEFFVEFLQNEEKKAFDDQPKDLDIKLSQVSFQYPNTSKYAVTDINLDIPVGTSLAIVGENGSGKSTLSKLIMGLYEPNKGKVCYGDHEVLDYNGISAVFQDYSKYQLTVEDNIGISDWQSNKPICAVIEESSFDLNDLKKDSKAMLSRAFGGIELSGGQWQRIAITRGLYRQHNVIVLDEPTAAIDPLEEEKVFKAFQAASRNKTSILVTHRLGSVKMADLIAVMDQGSIIELGSHRELMMAKGKYYDLFHAQSKWYKSV